MRAHMRAHLWEHTYESREEHKYEVPRAGTTLGGSRSRRNPHGHVRRAILCGILQEKTHMDMSQEPFCVEIYRKNAAPAFPGAHFVWKFIGKNAHGHCTRAILYGNFHQKSRKPPSPPGPTRAPFYSYRKNPFSVATLFGEKLDLTTGDLT